VDWLYPPDSPWSTGVTPGTLFFYWCTPVLGWLILRLRPNWKEFNKHKETHGLDEAARRLRGEARERAVRMITFAAVIGLGGWALTVLAVRLLG
jgi:hypothetical protein